MTEQSSSLLEVLAEIPDFRQSQGRRYELAGVLALAICAILCGYRSYGAIAEWGRNYGETRLRALGFMEGRSPCAATLHTILRQLERTQVEKKLGAWAEGLLIKLGLARDELEAIAIDGKSLRGSKRQGPVGGHLLSALGHRLGVTLNQVAVGDKSNEITAIMSVLNGLVVEGRIITVDALLTQRAIAQTIVERGGDYVMIVKGNQGSLQEEIATVFVDTKEEKERFSQIETGHGRIEQRELSVSRELEGYSSWPGLKQVFAVERHVVMKRSGIQREETIYGVTSLGPERAGAKQLLELVRGHWQIENKSHWVRDVTFDEDRSQVRSGSIPQVMAALRNTAIGLMRWAGETNIAAGCRRFAAQPWAALALIGINQKTE